MKELFVTGDTEHVLAREFMARANRSGRYHVVPRDRVWRPEHEIIVDFNVAVTEVSADALQRARERTKECLQRFMYRSALKYIYVFCDGSVHDAVMVRQFRTDYGVDICLLDLGVLYGDGVSSKVADIEADIESSNGIIRFVDAPTSVLTTSISDASRSIYSALDSKTTKHTPATDERISVLAARLSRRHFQVRTHFIFF